MAEARRVRLHRQIGEREEAGYGERAREIAAELAVHFERGHDYHKAIQYLQQASENALRRSAYREALSLLTKGLNLLKTDPQAPERLQHELALQIHLGLVLAGLKGQAATEAGVAFRRARELGQHLGDFPQLFTALAGLRRFYTGQGELPATRELAQQMLAVAQRVCDPALLVEAHHALGGIRCIGWASLWPPERSWSKALPSMTSSSINLWPSCMASPRASSAGTMPYTYCGYWATLSRPYREVRRPSP